MGISIEIALYDTLKETVAFIDNGDRQFLDQFNLTVPRFTVLKHTYNNPGVSLTKLSLLMRTDKSNTTRLIQNLQEEGLIIRHRSETDRRTSCLYLSEKGEQLFQRALSAHEQYTRDRFAALNFEIDNLVSNLVTINHKLERDLARDK